MSVTHVKLTARPDTWFKAGTEVYTYDSTQDNPVRMTLEEWESWMKPQPFVVLVSGLRVCENNECERGMGCKPGDERWDGEACGWDEFDVEMVEGVR